MKVTLRQVTLQEKEILRNLLEKYDYEFSQYDRRDVNALGLYGYDYLDNYWTEENRWAYFILVQPNPQESPQLAGFVMVNNLPEVEGRETDFQMAEFFVLYKYRRAGVGRQAFLQTMALHKGQWQLKRHPKNLASVRFWDRVIAEYTHGNYELAAACPNTAYDDGTLGDVFFFRS